MSPRISPAIHKPKGWNWLFVGSGVVGVVTALVCLVGALWVKEWDTFPPALTAWEQFDDTSDWRAQLGSAISNAYQANKDKMDRKAIWVQVSQGLLLLETVSFALAASLDAHLF